MQGDLWIKCMRDGETKGLGSIEMKENRGDNKASYNILAVALKHIAFRAIAFRAIALKQIPKHARPPGLRMIGFCGFGVRNDFATLISSLETSIFVRNQG